jgi:trans-2-enoyl-CoA reductase
MVKDTKAHARLYARATSGWEIYRNGNLAATVTDFRSAQAIASQLRKLGGEIRIQSPSRTVFIGELEFEV